MHLRRKFPDTSSQMEAANESAIDLASLLEPAPNHSPVRIGYRSEDHGSYKSFLDVISDIDCDGLHMARPCGMASLKIAYTASRNLRIAWFSDTFPGQFTAKRMAAAQIHLSSTNSVSRRYGTLPNANVDALFHICLRHTLRCAADHGRCDPCCTCS
jgi:hypothetical protein